MALRMWLQSFTKTSTPLRPKQSSVLQDPCVPERTEQFLQPGSTVTADFSHRRETVHAICRIEKQNVESVRLHIISEMGKVSLIGLKENATGQLEVKNRVFPFQVTQVALPIVTVRLFLNQAHPSYRQLLRIPTAFSLQLRHCGSNSSIIVGRGIDISAGGLCFVFSSLHIPHPGTLYDLEITLPISKDEQAFFSVIAEVRWAKRTKGEIQVGVEVHDRAQRKILALAVTKLQQAMSRHPEDYLLT